MSTVVYGCALLAGTGALAAALTFMVRRLARSEGSSRRQVENPRDASALAGEGAHTPSPHSAYERVSRLMRAMPARHPEHLTARLDPADEAWLAEIAHVEGLRQMARDVLSEGQV